MSVAVASSSSNGPAGKNKSADEDAAARQAESKADSYFGDVRLRETDVLHTDEDVVVSMKNVHKTYLLGVEGIPALRGVSVTIRKGEFVVVFGTSGGGKTTMLNLIGTIDKPTKGEMFLCGHRITDRTSDALLAEIRLKKMGFVFQTFNLLGALTAQENVEMPMVLLGELSAAERAKRATELLSTVGLSKRLDHFPSQLSGGEQQRVTIARAIANRPELLLLDEPTGDLDSVNGAIVMDLLTKLHERGLTLVMVTHDVHLKSFADRVIWMRDGKIARVDTNSDESKRKVREELAAELAAHRAKIAKPVSRTIEIRHPLHYATDPSYDAAAKPADLSPEEIDAAAAAGLPVGTKAAAAAAAAPAAAAPDVGAAAGKKKKKKAKNAILDLDDDNDNEDLESAED